MGEAATFFPGQLIQEADGSFGINVTGHIHAQGLDIDAGTTLTPPNQQRVRWLRTSDGAVVADLTAWKVGAGDVLQVEARAVDVGDNAQLLLLATDKNGSQDFIQAINFGPPGTANQISISSGGQVRTLINGAGKSRFVQMPAVQLSATGTDTLAWPAAGAGSNIKNISLPGATGTVFGLGIPNGFVLNPGVFDAGEMVLATPAGGGVCQFQAYTRASGAPGINGQMGFSYLLWGS